MPFPRLLSKTLRKLTLVKKNIADSALSSQGWYYILNMTYFSLFLSLPWLSYDTYTKCFEMFNFLFRKVLVEG